MNPQECSVLIKIVVFILTYGPIVGMLLGFLVAIEAWHLVEDLIKYRTSYQRAAYMDGWGLPLWFTMIGVISLVFGLIPPARDWYIHDVIGIPVACSLKPSKQEGPK